MSAAVENLLEATIGDGNVAQSYVADLAGPSDSVTCTSSSLRMLRSVLEGSDKQYTDDTLLQLLNRSGGNVDVAVDCLFSSAVANINGTSGAFSSLSVQCSCPSQPGTAKRGNTPSSEDEGPSCKKQKNSDTGEPWSSTLDASYLRRSAECSTSQTGLQGSNAGAPRTNKRCGWRCLKCLVLRSSENPSIRVQNLPLPQCRTKGRLYTSPGVGIPSRIEPAVPLQFPIRVGSFVIEIPEEKAVSLKIPKKAECCLRWGPMEYILLFFHMTSSNGRTRSICEEELHLQIPTVQLEKQGFSKEFVQCLWQLYHRSCLHFSSELLWVPRSGKNEGHRKTTEYGKKIVAGVKIGIEILQGFEVHDEGNGEFSKRNKPAALGVVLKGLLHNGQGLMYGPDSDCLLNWLNHDDLKQSHSQEWICRAVTPQEFVDSESSSMSRNTKFVLKRQSSKRPRCCRNLHSRAAGHLKKKGISAAEGALYEEVLTRHLSTSRMCMHGDDDSHLCSSFDVFKVFEEVSNLNMPLARLPSGVTSQAKRYQLQALAWMKLREDATLESAKSARKKPLYLHPCWMQVVTEDGQVLYVNRVNSAISLNFYTAPSSTTCGGLLCDEMGLGKTLEILMLIMAHPPPEGWAEKTKRSRRGSKMAWGAKYKRDISSAISTAENRTVVEDADVTAIKATLIVVPATLINQWKQEINAHIKPGKLKWAVYNGYEEIAWGKLDIVFTSYEVLRRLVTSGASPLLKYGFWRIVLDEAQLVAKSNSVAALTASAIYRRHAWVVTGTPVTARLEELQGLLDFLAVEPFGEPSVWHAMFQGPFARRERTGLQRLRLLLKTIMLRRTKQQVQKETNIPSCTKEDISITLSSTEGANYDYCYKEFAQSVEVLRRKRARRGPVEGFDPNNLSSKVTGRMLAALTRLRQSCCHPQIIKKESGFLGNIRLTMEEIMQKLVIKAKMEYDAATRDWIQSRIALAAVRCSRNDLKLLVTEIQSYKASIGQRYSCHKLATNSRQNLTTKESSDKIEESKDGEISESAHETDTAKKAYGADHKHLRLWSRLELSAWMAYSKLLEEDRTGEDVTSEAAAVRYAMDLLKLELGTPQTKPVADVKTRAGKKREISFLKGETTPETSGYSWKRCRSEDKLVKDVGKARLSMEKLLHNEKHLEEKRTQMWKGKDKKEEVSSPTSESNNSRLGLEEDSRGFADNDNETGDPMHENTTTCPVCFESFLDNSSVTVCGHYFCSHCIQEVVSARDKSSKCPICRTPLQLSDIFSVCLQSEDDLPDLNGEWGAKISALLSELILLGERDPGAKSVIFSSWSRLLNIVSAALSENKMPHTYLTGSEQNKQEAIRRFNTDPNIRCILVILATAGGASGLTLTAASTVFILEPSLNPGLEAQAAARVHRLTQTRPARVIRFIAERTIEEKILALQQKKMTIGATSGLVFEELHGNDLLELIGNG